MIFLVFYRFFCRISTFPLFRSFSYSAKIRAMDDAKMKRAQRDAEEEMENQREAELEQQVVGGGVKEKEKEVEVTIGAVSKSGNHF